MRRYQIYLDEAQHTEVTERAARDGLSASAVIRRAIDAELARPDDVDRAEAWRAAVEGSAGAAPALPDGRAYLDDVRAAERAKATR